MGQRNKFVILIDVGRPFGPGPDPLTQLSAATY